MNIISNWVKKVFNDPQVVIFLLIFCSIVLIFKTMGSILTPVFTSLILAYLLEGLIAPLEKKGCPRIIAVLLVFSLFLLGFLFLLLGLTPLLSHQISQFLHEIPKMIASWQTQLSQLPQKYPDLLTKAQLDKFVSTISSQIGEIGKQFLSISLASVKGAINFVVYIILVPIMVFFFLKDKNKIVAFFRQFLPSEMGLTSQIWQEANHKTAKFIQGKIWEILIIWVATYFTFFFLKLQFAVLLSFLVGLSVIVPYVGATVMTLPVALVAYFQWGMTMKFIYVVVGYLIIQVLDGNLLVPLLLSGIVNLHPLAVIIGIIVFGGIWGFWGVFFAIPLATLIHAILNAWPKDKQQKGDG